MRCALVATLLVGAGLGQAVFRTGAKLVLVPVSVLDKAGRPVRGLTQKDFHLQFDRRLVAITGFDAVDTEGVGVPPPQPLPPNVFVNVPQETAVPDTRVVLLIDYLNATPADRHRIQRQLKRFLEQELRGGEAVAVYGMADSLLLLQPFSDNPTALAQAAERALESKPGKAAPGLPPPAVVGSAVAEPASATAAAAAALTANSGPPSGGGQNDAAIEYFFARAQWQQINLNRYLRARATLAELRQLARALAGIPGRKAVLWLTGDASPMNPSLLNMASLQDPATAALRVQSGELAETYQALSAADISLFPVDVRGVNNAAFVTAETGMTHEQFRQSIGESGARGEDASAGPTDLAASEAANSALAMSTAAVATGGQVFAGGNDLAALLYRAQSLWGAYYVLSAAAPPAGKAAAYHAIEVSVDRKGTRLLFRRGFTTTPDKDVFSPPMRRRALEEAAQALTNATGLEIILRLGKPRRHGKGAEAPFTATLWGASLAHEAVPEGQRYYFSILSLTFDAQGKVVAGRHEDMDRVLTAEQAGQVAATGYTFAGSFLLPGAGIYYGRLVVRDNLSGKVGSITVALR